MTPDTIRNLEEITFRGWPALETARYDGWVLRAANSYTGRANAINPLHDSSLLLDEKIAYCDAWYAARGIAPIFRLNAAMQPTDLDVQLAAQGYRRFNESRVMVAEIAEVNPAGSPPQWRVEGFTRDTPNTLTSEFHIAPTPTDAWIADLCRLNPRHTPHVATVRLLFERMPPKRLFASLRADGQTVSVGLGVLHDGYLGLYDIVTDEQQRGRGYGRALVVGLVDAARDAGIPRAYLQVAAGNAPAIRLYEGLGFSVGYEYWYRAMDGHS